MRQVSDGGCCANVEGVMLARCVVQCSAHDECEFLGVTGFCHAPMDGTSKSGDTWSVSALHHEVPWKREGTHAMSDLQNGNEEAHG